MQLMRRRASDRAAWNNVSRSLRGIVSPTSACHPVNTGETARIVDRILQDSSASSSEALRNVNVNATNECILKDSQGQLVRWKSIEEFNERGRLMSGDDVLEKSNVTIYKFPLAGREHSVSILSSQFLSRSMKEGSKRTEAVGKPNLKGYWRLSFGCSDGVHWKDRGKSFHTEVRVGRSGNKLENSGEDGSFKLREKKISMGTPKISRTKTATLESPGCELVVDTVRAKGLEYNANYEENGELIRKTVSQKLRHVKKGFKNKIKKDLNNSDEVGSVKLTASSRKKENNAGVIDISNKGMVARKSLTLEPVVDTETDFETENGEVKSNDEVNSKLLMKPASKTQRQSHVEMLKFSPPHGTVKGSSTLAMKAVSEPRERDEEEKSSPVHGMAEGKSELVMKAVSHPQQRAHENTVKSSPAHEIVMQALQPWEAGYQVHNQDHAEADRRASEQAMAILRAALDEADEETDGKVKREFQRSLKVGIVGAPNAGKSLLTNQLVGTRVSAVSCKTNTTHREHLGVYTKGETQLLYYDTPGLHLDIEGSPLRVPVRHRVLDAWKTADYCEALVVLVDAERQIRRPDRRVKHLVEKLGNEHMVSQKRILCLNKVDIIDPKRLLLPLAKEYEELPGYDRIFMISGLTGSGVKDVTDYLVNQAVLRPWDEDPEFPDRHDMALEIVREQIFEHLHEELPHTTKQRLVSWKVLSDGSIRIQQHLLVAKKEHERMLIGKNGAVIGDIGIKARQELQKILGVKVHLILDVVRED